MPRADRRRADRDRKHQKMHVQRARADFFPGFLRRLPRAEHVGHHPAKERHASGQPQAFGSETGGPGGQAAPGLKSEGFPLVGRVRVAVPMPVLRAVFVPMLLLLAGNERQPARDELRPAERLPAPEPDGRRARLFFDQRMAEHLLDHHARVPLPGPVGLDRVAALQAIASGIEHGAMRAGGLRHGVAHALREPSARVVAQCRHGQFAAPRLERDGFQPGLLAEHPRHVFHHANVVRRGLG